MRRQGNKNKKTPGKSGFSLVEAAIVLGVVGLVIGGIWVSAAAVRANMQTSQALSNILSVVQNIRTLYAYATPPSGANDVTDAMVKAGVFPGDMVQGTGAVNVAGSPVTIFLDSDRMEIDYGAMPRDVCVKLVMRLSSQDEKTGLSLTQVGIQEFNTPMSLTEAVGACDNGSAINWTYSLRGQKIDISTGGASLPEDM